MQGIRPCAGCHIWQLPCGSLSKYGSCHIWGSAMPIPVTCYACTLRLVGRGAAGSWTVHRGGDRGGRWVLRDRRAKSLRVRAWVGRRCACRILVMVPKFCRHVIRPPTEGSVCQQDGDLQSVLRCRPLTTALCSAHIHYVYRG